MRKNQGTNGNLEFHIPNIKKKIVSVEKFNFHQVLHIKTLSCSWLTINNDGGGGATKHIWVTFMFIRLTIAKLCVTLLKDNTKMTFFGLHVTFYCLFCFMTVCMHFWRFVLMFLYIFSLYQYIWFEWINWTCCDIILYIFLKNRYNFITLQITVIESDN